MSERFSCHLPQVLLPQRSRQALSGYLLSYSCRSRQIPSRELLAFRAFALAKLRHIEHTALPMSAPCKNALAYANTQLKAVLSHSSYLVKTLPPRAEGYSARRTSSH